MRDLKTYTPPEPGELRLTITLPDGHTIDCRGYHWDLLLSRPEPHGPESLTLTISPVETVKTAPVPTIPMRIGP